MPFPDPYGPELSAAFNRYVIPMTGGTPRWAWLLHGNFARMDRADRHRFLAPLAGSAREVSDHELTTLLDGEWRSRLTAAWLIGLDRREQFRGPIGELLLASQDTYASQYPQAPIAQPGKSRAAHKATAAQVPAQADHDGVPVYGGSYGET
jgi:hypothetical protein